MIELLKKLEWIDGYCRICYRREIEGHKENCALAKMLTEDYRDDLMMELNECKWKLAHYRARELMAGGREGLMK